MTSIFIPVSCCGEEHTVEINRRGRLRFLNHTKEEIRAEKAAVKLGGKAMGCVEWALAWVETRNTGYVPAKFVGKREACLWSSPYQRRCDRLHQRGAGRRQYTLLNNLVGRKEEAKAVAGHTLRELTLAAISCGMTSSFSVDFCQDCLCITLDTDAPQGAARIPLGWLLLKRKKEVVIRDVAPVVELALSRAIPGKTLQRTSSWLLLKWDEDKDTCDLICQAHDGRIYKVAGVRSEYIYDWRKK